MTWVPVFDEVWRHSNTPLCSLVFGGIRGYRRAAQVFGYHAFVCLWCAEGTKP
jgi:hypothetical protein